LEGREMKKVKIYNCHTNIGIKSLENYVLYKDYEKLEEENEELKEALQHALNVVLLKYVGIQAFLNVWKKEYDLAYKE